MINNPEKFNNFILDESACNGKLDKEIISFYNTFLVSQQKKFKTQQRVSFFTLSLKKQQESKFSKISLKNQQGSHFSKKSLTLQQKKSK